MIVPNLPISKKSILLMVEKYRLVFNIKGEKSGGNTMRLLKIKIFSQATSRDFFLPAIYSAGLTFLLGWSIVWSYVVCEKVMENIHIQFCCNFIMHWNRHRYTLRYTNGNVKIDRFSVSWVCKTRKSAGFQISVLVIFAVQKSIPFKGTVSITT